MKEIICRTDKEIEEIISLLQKETHHNTRKLILKAIKSVCESPVATKSIEEFTNSVRDKVLTERQAGIY